jgi:hypothetical protein
MKLTPKTLERFMQMSEDMKKDISFNKHTGKWAWRDRGESEEVCVGFTTFWEALCDIVEPYMEGEE